jgi:hypothetical protein
MNSNGAFDYRNPAAVRKAGTRCNLLDIQVHMMHIKSAIKDERIDIWWEQSM